MKVPVAGTSFEERIITIAERQRGRVGRPQLLAVGLSKSSIARLVAAGYLLTEHAGVYAVGHRTSIPGARETSALLAVRPGAHLSHATALRWWGIEHLDRDDHGGRGDRGSPQIHVTVPGTGTSNPDGVAVHRSTILAPRDLRRHGGLPVHSVARALLGRRRPTRPDARARP